MSAQPLLPLPARAFFGVFDDEDLSANSLQIWSVWAKCSDDSTSVILPKQGRSMGSNGLVLRAGAARHSLTYMSSMAIMLMVQ